MRQDWLRSHTSPKHPVHFFHVYLFYVACMSPLPIRTVCKPVVQLASASRT